MLEAGPKSDATNDPEILAKKISDMCDAREASYCIGADGRTIGRFHPIGQKQKTDLNIPLRIGQPQSRDC